MTRAEIREYVRGIVDAAPPLTATDAERLRVLMARSPRLAVERDATPRPAAVCAAA